MDLDIAFEELNIETWIKGEASNDELNITSCILISPKMKKVFFKRLSTYQNVTLKLNTVTITSGLKDDPVYSDVNFLPNIFTQGTCIPDESFVVFSLGRAERANYIKVNFKLELVHTEFYSASQIPTTFSRFYDSGQFYDIEFVEKRQFTPETELELSIEQRRLYAHKILLANSSAHFNEKFFCSMQGPDRPEISMWCHYEVFEVLLRFMYTRTFDCDLVQASDFRFWAQVFENAQLVEISELQKIALWFAYCMVGPDEIFELLNMCKEQKECDFIVKDVLAYMAENWGDISS